MSDTFSPDPLVRENVAVEERSMDSELVVAIPEESLTGSPLDPNIEDDEGDQQTLAPHNDTGPRKLRPYQNEAVDAVHTSWNQGKQRVSVVLPTGTGKDLSVDTLIPVPGGFRILEDIGVGDFVYSPSGHPVEVIGVMNKGVQPVWRVTFTDRSSVLAGGGHLWEVADSSGAVRVETTEELLRLGLRDPDSREWKFSIPMTSPLQRGWTPTHAHINGSTPVEDVSWFSDQYGDDVCEEAPVRAPYRGRTPVSNTLERAARDPRSPLSRQVAGSGRTLSEYTCDVAYALGKRAMTDASVSRKEIDHCLIGPVEYRLAFLAAVVDEGARGDIARSRIKVPSMLAESVTEVVTSLGGTATPTRSVSGRHVGLRIRIPSRIKVPAQRVRAEFVSSVPQRKIVSIEPDGYARTKCLTVNDPRGLFLCTRSHIVTHNSTVIAKVANDAVDRSERVLALAHREELIDQIAASILAVNPDAEVGIVQGADRYEPDNPIVVASFQTLSRSPKKLAALGSRDVILADECHHISAPTYVKVLEDIGAMDDASGVKSCGFTATMHRDDGKALGEVWSEVVFERDFSWAIKNGFLVPPKGKTVAIEGLNRLNSVHVRAGDYVREELEEVMAASVDSTVDAILTHCPKGSAMIVFAVSVAHANALAEKLTASGIRAECITGKHKRDQRRPVYDAYHRGDLDALVTVAVLTEGADFPRCDTVVMARPTRSKVLLSQCIGRAVRLYTDPLTGKDKTHATVLDLTGVTRDLKMASLTDLWPQAEREFFSETGEQLEPPSDPSPMHVNERHGKIALEDIDLLGPEMQAHLREVVWLTTDRAITGGSVSAENAEILFLPTRDPFTYYFIWPPLDQMDTSQVTLGKLDRQGNAVLWSGADGVPVVGTLQQAMDAAEQVAGRKDCISRRAGWRRPQVRPTDSQLKTARAVGVADPESLTRGQVSDRLSTIFASRAFSSVLKRTARR